MLTLIKSASAGMAVSQYILGEYKEETPDAILLDNVVLIVEIPHPQGGSVLQYMPDHFFSLKPTHVQKTAIAYYRTVDESETDIVKEYNNSLQQIRAAKSGLLMGAQAQAAGQKLDFKR